MSDKDSKRYYWLKLKEDFFKQYKMKILKALPNGRIYALIYLELLAESTSHEGELRFSKMMPYDIPSLAAVIDEDKDVLQAAVETFQRLELIEILDDQTIYMNAIKGMIGSETGQTIRKREAKEVNITAQLPNNYQKNTLEIRDKRIDIRDKIIDYLSSSYITWSKLGESADSLDHKREMMIEIIGEMNEIPEKETVERVYNNLIIQGDTLRNPIGYIIKCLKGEK